MKRNSPGLITFLVLYAAGLTAFYSTTTTLPEPTTANFTEAQERDFHIAAVPLRQKRATLAIVVTSLAEIKAGEVDPAAIGFLLPEGHIDVQVPGHDLNQVTVLERHPDWQLVEYRFSNAHNSVSRYRAFTDHIEPVSYRSYAGAQALFPAIGLLIPAALLSWFINFVWRQVAGAEA